AVARRGDPLVVPRARRLAVAGGELELAANLVDRAQAVAVALEAVGHVGDRRVELRARHLGKAAQVVRRPLVAPEEPALGEALGVAVALGEEPREGDDLLL